MRISKETIRKNGGKPPLAISLRDSFAAVESIV
jgi:hypothetical protein